MWGKDPHCEMCRKLTDWPDGFEADHVLPLHKGGEDTEANMQVLCIDCHAKKTNHDLGRRNVAEIGPDGWPVEPNAMPAGIT